MMMQIIPVIDLKAGEVVHATCGLRTHYMPIQSSLSKSSNPFDIVLGLLKLYRFQRIYIADIDAIQGVSNHFDLIRQMADAFPDISWWVDYGIQDLQRLRFTQQKNIRTVIGTENIASKDAYLKLQHTPNDGAILSLDKLNGHELGLAALHQSAELWPGDVICMTLDHVGSKIGVDIERIAHLQELNTMRAQPSHLYAAGGVRHVEDLIKLSQLGLSGTLVATALHRGVLKPADIEDIAMT